MRSFKTGGIVVAALLLTSCLDRSASSPTAPRGSSSGSIDRPTITTDAAPSIAMGAGEDPYSGTGGVSCPKDAPPADGYAVQPAACIEISGSTKVQPNQSQTLTCDGWSSWQAPQSPVVLHYPVSADVPRHWAIGGSTVATLVPNADARTAVLTGKAYGSTVVQCTIGTSPAVGSRDVLVPSPVTPTGISLTLLPSSIPAGESVQAGVKVYLSDGTTESPTTRAVTWSSSNPGVATVSASSGQATIYTSNQGSAVITVTSAGFTASQTLTVTAPAVATTFDVTPSSLDINTGQAVVVSVSNVMDQYARPYTRPGGNTAVFAVSNTTVASVPATPALSQTVTGSAAGSTTLQILVNGAALRSIPLVVRPTVTISGISSNAVIGTSYTFTANTAGCNTTCTYQWYQDWVDTPTGISRERVFGTAQTQIVPTPGDTYSYELSVVIVSNGVSASVVKIVHVKQPTSCTSKTGC